MEESKRTFEDKPAVLERVPLLLGIIGPSGCGKTFSALRLATGIQRATGGDIGFIDTEARRALHYANRFKFRHVPFGAPFSPLDYLAAIEHFVIKKGVKTIIVDSMSHEHEGPGGVLEEHESETTRLAEAWKCSRDAAQMSAWAGPKAKRRRLINSILQMDINAIFCFRAKEKIKPVKGGKPQEMGFMPIAGEEFVYEMTCNFLLYPQSKGKPTLSPTEIGEKMIAKEVPEQFIGLLRPGVQLDEDIGEHMARWAAGEHQQVQSAQQMTKKRDPVAGLQALLALTSSVGAEPRILAALGHNHRSELVEDDCVHLASWWKQLKANPGGFDNMFGDFAEEPVDDTETSP